MGTNEHFTAIVADDELLARDVILTYLKAYPNIKVIAECSNGIEAVTAIDEMRPDLVFLDIQMPELDGFGVLKEIDPAVMPVVIFTTAYDQYAVQAFETQALDYLLKPFDRDRFNAAITKALYYLSLKQDNKASEIIKALISSYQVLQKKTNGNVDHIVVKDTRRILFVKFRDIYWFQASGDYITIHTAKSRHLINQALDDLEKKLDPAQFVRIHRSAIINKDRIVELQPYTNGEYFVLLENNEKVKLSRGYKHVLKELLGK
jgi:two-component system LytT family response regulator